MLMQRRTFVLSLAAIGAAAQIAAQGSRIATDSPTATIASLQQGLVAAARDAPSASLAQRYSALEPLVVATHDLDYIAEFALRRQWSMLTEQDRARFIAAFRRLSVMTYAARFESVGENTFRPITASPADSNGRVQVSTAIARAQQPDVSLEYVLQQDGQSWRIVNVIADGVSDLALKRAEYSRVFTSGGIDGLIAELEQQAQRLERG